MAAATALSAAEHLRLGLGRRAPLPRDGVSRWHPRRRYDLTRREHEVLQLLAGGLGQDDIARRLFISSKTVAPHIQRLLAKLGVHSRAQAIALAHREQLVATKTAPTVV